MNARPRLGVLGPLMGSKIGVITPGEVLAGLWRREGYHVITASSKLNRFVRAIDILRTTFRHRRDFDVVCLQVYGGRSFVVEDPTALLARGRGRRIVMHLHGGSMPDFMQRFPSWSLRVLKRADAIVTPSLFLARALRKSGLNAIVIPNVIDLHAYPFHQRAEVRPRLLWMRAFDPAYNPTMALRVLARVREKNPSATLTMGGPDQGLLANTKRLAKQLGIADAVAFPGYLDHAAKLKAAAEHDIYLNTNCIDNAPVTVVEMAAFGVPIVATSVGGIPDLLEDGTNALLVADDDDEAMASAVERLCASPDLAQALSQAARAVAERSAREQVLPAWNRLFEELSPVACD